MKTQYVVTKIVMLKKKSNCDLMDHHQTFSSFLGHSDYYMCNGLLLDWGKVVSFNLFWIWFGDLPPFLDLFFFRGGGYKLCYLMLYVIAISILSNSNGKLIKTFWTKELQFRYLYLFTLVYFTMYAHYLNHLGHMSC